MPLARCLRTSRYDPSQERRRQCRGRPLWLESLEERSVPSIIFDNATIATTSDGGGPVIDQVHVELIFWGSGWDTGRGPALRSQTEAAVDTIASGPYVAQLNEYRATIRSGSRVGSLTINSSSPKKVFTDTDVQLMLTTNIQNQVLPDPATDSQLFYMVIPQPGSMGQVAGQRAGGLHNYVHFGPAPAHYGWTGNSVGTLDDVTYFFSHELAEAVTDPEGTAIQVNPRSTGFWNEISDLPAQNYSYRVNGYLVNSWFSQANHAYIVPTGQAQNFYVSSARALTINGDQLSSAGDTITVDQASGGYMVTLNGEVAQFDAREWFTGGPAVSSITINTGTGSDTVNVERTIADRPVTVNLGDGSDTVNLSPTAQSLSNLTGTVTVNGGSGFDSLFVWDQNGIVGRTFTITDTTIARNGAATLNYNSLSNLVLLAGNGGNTFNVQGTSAPMTLKAGGGPNMLVGTNSTNTWDIVGTDAGSLMSASIAGSVAFSSIQNLTGGAAPNAFVFSDGAGISGNLDGGSGGSLDYSAYLSSVIVDLPMATATGVGGSISHIQNVSGGSGGGPGVYNILVGNGGNTLTAGNGRRNLLIAGSSASTLIGGDDDDILIGGTTSYDMDVASLMAIMNYWSGTSDDYATRVSNLMAGNGAPLLDPTTVSSNGGGNTLTGGPGLNLYYGNDTDNTDFDPNSGAVFVPV